MMTSPFPASSPSLAYRNILTRHQDPDYQRPACMYHRGPLLTFLLVEYGALARAVVDMSPPSKQATKQTPAHPAMRMKMRIRTTTRVRMDATPHKRRAPANQPRRSSFSSSSSSSPSSSLPVPFTGRLWLNLEFPWPSQASRLLLDLFLTLRPSSLAAPAIGRLTLNAGQSGLRSSSLS
jgi:hypothetical protein